jgi:hypothetical protein
MEDHLIIAWSQIVAMSEREVIVDDGVTTRQAKHRRLPSLSVERFAKGSPDAVVSDEADVTC